LGRRTPFPCGCGARHLLDGADFDEAATAFDDAYQPARRFYFAMAF
jgi:hypothetical protein